MNIGNFLADATGVALQSGVGIRTHGLWAIIALVAVAALVMFASDDPAVAVFTGLAVMLGAVMWGHHQNGGVYEANVAAVEKAYSVELAAESGDGGPRFPADGGSRKVTFRGDDGKLVPGYLYVNDGMVYLQDEDQEPVEPETSRKENTPTPLNDDANPTPEPTSDTVDAPAPENDEG